MAVDIIAGLDKIQQSAQAKVGLQVPAGGFQVTVAIIHNGKPGNEYPIGRFLQRIYGFEDIEKFGITGWLEMLDPYNLVRNGMILGQELLYLEFCTAGAEKAGIEDQWKVSFTKKNPLYIHKVQDLKALATGEGESQSALTYRLHFCSPELIQNDRVRISRTLQGTYSDMIKNILKNDLKTPKKFEKDKNFIETGISIEMNSTSSFLKNYYLSSQNKAPSVIIVDDDVKEKSKLLYNKLLYLFELILKKGIREKEFRDVNTKIVSMNILTSLQGINWFCIFNDKMMKIKPIYYELFNE